LQSYLPPSTTLQVTILNQTLQATSRLLQTDTTPANNITSIYAVTQQNISISMPEQYQFSNSTKKTVKEVNSAANGGATANQAAMAINTVVNLQSGSVSQTMINFQLYSSMRYMTISFPPNMITFFEGCLVQSTTLDFKPNLPNNSYNTSTLTTFPAPPNQFGLYSLSPFFLINFGTTISTSIVRWCISSVPDDRLY